MRANIARIQSLTRAVQKDGPSDEVLKQLVLHMADEIIWLARELDQVKMTAQRADNAARRMGVFR